MTPITIDRDLPKRWLKTLEFIEGCNGVAVLDPIDLKELLESVRAALSAPATAPEQCGHCGRRVIDAPWPVRDTTPEQPSWQDAPTKPGMWACLYMGELSTAIFNAYEIEHFDASEMGGCRWQFIPEDNQ